MTEEGKITKIQGDKAWILIQRTTMCDSCSSSGMCNTIGGGKYMEVMAFNTAKGIIDDMVILSMVTSSLYKITFLVYLLPVLALLAGAIAGIRLGTLLSYDPELTSLCLALFSLITTFLLVRIIGKRMSNNKKYLPEVIKIIKPPKIKKSDD